MTSLVSKQLYLLDGDYIIAELVGPNSAFTKLIMSTSGLPLNQARVGNGFDLARLIAYFKLNDSTTDVVLKLTYSFTAWGKAMKNKVAKELGRPRVAYLPWDGSNWVYPWVELTEIIRNDSPLDEYSWGYLEFKLDGVPDPLIGGC